MDTLQHFEQSLKESGKSPHTIKAYLSDLRQFSEWLKGTYGEDEPLPRSITRLDVSQYKSYMLGVTHRKPSGINRALASISAYCEWACTTGYLTDNPASHVAQAQQVKTPPKSISEQELNRLYRSVYKGGKCRDIAIIELMAGAGLRVGEVESLNLTDIQIGERKGFVDVRQGKGAKYRRVPLNTDTRKALIDYIQVRPKEEEALFVSQKGGRLTANAIWKTVKKYGNLAGLDDLSPHSLRHTFGTQLIRKHGVDIVTAATLMGHSNISTTAIYTKPNEQDLAEAVERLSKIR